MSTAHPIGSVDSFEPSSMQSRSLVDSSGTEHRVLVVRIDDSFYALGEICSHADVSLAEGTVWPDEREVECPKHGSMFSVDSGQPSCFPATKPVPVYDVSVTDHTVVVTLP
jgi:3-phenylpropionate/trans-cinnamate dioxygenase ferredoxin component